ncbi:MAG: tetratricopeptide repeat protein [Cyclobacteriaceae bacterium]
MSYSLLLFKVSPHLQKYQTNSYRLLGRYVKVLMLLFGMGLTSVQAQDLVSQERSERLYSTAIDLMEKKQYAAARSNFSEYLKLHAVADLKRVTAEYSLAVCALNLYHSDAEKMFTNFIANHPNHPLSSTANFDLANFFYLEKNYKKASTYYAKIDYQGLTAEQQNAAHFGAGYSFFSQKFLKEALDQFNFVKMQGGQYGPAASYYAGFVEYSQGDFENALVDLKRAEQNEAYASIVPYLIANVYYKKGDYESLLTYATSIQNRQGITNADEIALLKAEAYYKKKDYTSALTAYNAFLEDKNEGADKGVLLRAGYSAFVTQQNAVALQYLKQSFTDKDSIGYYSSYYLGLIYLKSNQKPMALTSFDIARKYKIDQQLVEESTFQFAKVAYDMGRPDQAINEFEKFLTAFPRSVHVNEVKELLSHAYVNANNFNRAIDYIESLPKRNAAIDRAYQKATLLKGLDFFNKDNHEEAVQAFEKSLQTPVDNNYVAEASFWSGEALSILRKYDPAISHYQRIIGLTDLSPNWLVKARYGIGYCFFNQQQYDKALFNFKEFSNKATTGTPHLPDGVLRLADCYYISKSYNDAFINYKKAIELKTAYKYYAHIHSGIIFVFLRKYP